ncbi:IucA/IucC family siderophore biosynthesis protein, partial [Streptomyces sp. SID7804]|nr:IucA/IucC family siderophore biosynthesis protein [Streptomyces sp. SID7804]
MTLIPPPADDAARRADLAGRADAYAAVPLLNCLLREVARPLPAPDEGPHRTYLLAGVDRLLRVRGTRRPAAPEVYTAGAWRRVGHAELVKLVAEELR